MKKVALLILDGFGITAESPGTNAIRQADAPVIRGLFDRSSAALEASGLAVGVPEGQMGNSEIGHLTIGGGRIFAQSIVLINEMLETG
jgi:2,3-bisphosphoglycerate-independent phosphoglycerate mutase